MVVSEGAINNIMGGMENTAGVRLHSHRHKLKQRFDIIRKLGQGTYGKVQLAINKETGQEVAIKTIKKAKIETEQDLVRIRREIQIMSSVQHPQIIHIYEVFENREKMVLVMEYAAGGELYDYLSERKVLAEEEARRVFRQVASAVYYCHKHKICHRDLKLENILLDLDGNAKIADFGLSNVFDEKQRLDTFCGSPLYASPEIVKGIPYLGPEVDCWSLGVLLYTLVYGAMPFDGSNFRRLVKQITQGDFYEPSTPANASELIRQMLTVPSTERSTIEDICNHWWVNEGYSVSCLAEAETLANQTPVRLDLLLSLVPKHINSEHMLIQPDEEDVSQKSDSERAPPNLAIPPPPASVPEAENQNEALPLRSHSVGSVPPPGGVSVDILLEKKKKEKEKKKKDATSKKPPSRPPVEDEKKNKKNEEKTDEDKKKIVKKREPSTERESDKAKKRSRSIEREKEKSKKRESSADREKDKIKKRDSSTDREKEKVQKNDAFTDKEKDKLKKKDVVLESEITKKKADGDDDTKDKSESLAEKKTEKKSVKKEEPSPPRKSPSKKRESESAVSSAASTPTAESSNKIMGISKPQVQEKEPRKDSIVKTVSKKEVSDVKPTSKKSEIKKSDLEEKDTEKILIETAAKIKQAESRNENEEEKALSPLLSPVMSPPVSSPAASSQNSVHSSQATSPVRSRTGSESSTDAQQRPFRSDSSSRRQSKIFSKAALFDPALSAQQSKSPPPPTDRTKKVTRPGALNLSDLTKKFEEKPSVEKKSKVVTPFKVSDARKAFETKSDKGSFEAHRRKASVGSGGDSGTVSPKESLPTSPTRGDKVTSNNVPKVSSDVKVVRETSPLKISKSPSKETPKDKYDKPQKKESSPVKTVAKPVATKVQTTIKQKDLEESKQKQNKVSKEVDSKPATVEKKESSEKIIPITQRGDTSDSSDSESEAEKMLRELSEKRERLEMAKKEKMKKVSEGKEPPSPQKDIPSIREEYQSPSTTTKSPDRRGSDGQDIKEQKYATLPRGFKAKPDPNRPSIPKDTKEAIMSTTSIKNIDLKGDFAPSAFPSSSKDARVRRIPILKEIVPIPPEQVLAPTPRSPETERKPLGYHVPKVSSVDESPSGDSLRKKSQVEIVLNHQQGRQPPSGYDASKRSSITDINVSSQAREGSRPEFRTEVQHRIGSPEVKAHPEPQLQRARRERIIPIMLENGEDDEVTNENETTPVHKTIPSRSSAIQPSSSASSKASSVSSAPRNSGFGMTPLSPPVGPGTMLDRKKTPPAKISPEPIKKSRRERIIPIAVEGEGYVTPPVTESASSEKVRPFQRQGSSRGSVNRNRGFTLDKTESFSSAGEDEEDEEDDGFQILTAESLFSTLLSRVRSLTRKMANDENNRSGSIAVDRMRRAPQNNINSETHSSADSPGTQSGFWSSLYSPPRDLPNSRRVPDGLSRGQSREDDPFGGFGPPLWSRSLSRNTSDNESVFSEPSAPFSTLPRVKGEQSLSRRISAGWRSRRSAREESVVEGDEGLASFTPSRRQFYSRTLSRDLPLKNAGGETKRFNNNRNSWDASSPSGPLPRTSSASGSSIPTRFGQETNDRVTNAYKKKSNNNNNRSSVGLPVNGTSLLLQPTENELPKSGEATGRDGGPCEQRDQYSTVSAMTSSAYSEKLHKPASKQPVQQLTELVNELESIPDDISERQDEKLPQNVMGSAKPSPIPSPKPSKSLSSFHSQQPVVTPSGSNPNLVFTVTLSGSKPQSQVQNSPATPTVLLSGSTTKSGQQLIRQLSQTTTSAEFPNPNKNENLPQPTIKNTFIPYNPKSSKQADSEKFLSTTTVTHESDKTTTTTDIHYKSSPTKDERITRDLIDSDDVHQSNSDGGTEKSKYIWCPGQTFMKVNDFSKSPSSPNTKNYLTVEPYRRGRSEDLKSAINMANVSNTSVRGPVKSYRKSKSRDITPTIEAASEKFTQLNSGTLKRISPFEAYKRSKSKELGSAIDLVNNQSNDVRLKSPPPNDTNKSKSSLSQYEKAKISIEKQVERAMSPNREENAESCTDSSKEICNDDIKEKASKESEKPKSVYKIITSKFSRSTSNLGEEKNEPKLPSKEPEDNEKDDKFKLKRPSIFMKKTERSSSRTSVSEIEKKEEEDTEKLDKKSSKLSNALNKFLGRKFDDLSIKPNKNGPLNLPAKSTSVVTIPDKLKKPPRFRTKKFSKSQENLNQNDDDDEPNEYSIEDRAKSVLPSTNACGEVTLESATKGICNHLSQIEINITSRIGTMSPPPAENVEASNCITSDNRNLLSPNSASKMGHTPKKSPISVSETERTLTEKTNEFHDDGSVTPTESGNESSTGLEDIKEAEDESVMDRITRKSYYSRFNEPKRKSKLMRIDSRETMDQQLAAAKARLMQDEDGNTKSICDAVTPTRMPSQSPLSSVEGTTRKNARVHMGLRTISLPPDEGMCQYGGGGGVRSPLMRSPTPDDTAYVRHVRDETSYLYRPPSVTRDDPVPYRRQLSSNLEDSTRYKRLSSNRDDPSFFMRQASIPREEQSYRSPIVKNDNLNYQRIPDGIRDESQAFRQSFTKSELPRYHRLSTNFSDNDESRLSSFSKDDGKYKRSSITQNEQPLYSTQSLKIYDEDPCSPYCNRDLSSNQSDVKEKIYDRSPTSPSVSPSFPLYRTSQENDNFRNKGQDSDALAVASAAGKAAGEAAAAAAAAASSDTMCPRIPTPITPVSDSDAVKSAREELTRRLTPLTRISNLGGKKEPVSRPYRRTVTSGNLPLAHIEPSMSPIAERPPYRRTTTADLPPTDSRLRTNDTRRFQDPTRRFTGIRSTENGLDTPVASFSTHAPPYLGPTSSFSPSFSPPSMNTILRRNSFYRY